MIIHSAIGSTASSSRTICSGMMFWVSSARVATSSTPAAAAHMTALISIPSTQLPIPMTRCRIR